MEEEGGFFPYYVFIMAVDLTGAGAAAAADQHLEQTQNESFVASRLLCHT